MGGAQGSGDFRGAGLRAGQLLALLGLTGFAVSQPLLSVAGENPSLFIFAGVRRWDVAAFALLIALVPPLVLWGVVVLAGLADRRAGDAAFVGVSALLAAATAVQWAKSAGLEQGALLGAAGVLAALAFAALLVRFRPVALWTRFTAVLPAFAVLLFLVASPAGDLLRSPATAADASGAGVGDGEALPSVVFVMLDEFPLRSMLAEDGTIDAVRFPNLAALAGQSTWYRNYTVMANQTRQSIPSILSGKLPGGAAPVWTAHPDNLFSLLAPTHDLTVSETATQICGFSTCDIEGGRHDDRGGMRSVLSQMADVWRERVALRPVADVDFGQFAEDAEPLDPDRDRRDRAGETEVSARPGRATDFIDALGRGRSPSLSYLHLMLPHQPWTFYPDGQQFQGLSILPFAVAEIEPDDWAMAMLEQGHLFQAQYTDRLVGEVMERLREVGRFDESLIVVTADHGIGFDGERFPNLREADRETLGAIAFVPLLIKAPGQRDGRVDDTNLMAVDLLPTIAAEVGVPIPFEVDGHPMGSAAIADRGDRKVLYDFGHATHADPFEVIDYESGDHRPGAAERRVGPLDAGDHVLAGLLDHIDAAGWLRTPVGEIGAVPGGAATVRRLHQLLDADAEQVQALLRGTLDDPGAGDTVLLAIDGAVESAAPIRPDGTFDLVVPPGLPLGPGTDVRLFQVGGEVPVELALAQG